MKLWCGNLPHNWDESDLAGFTGAREAIIKRDEFGRSRGWGTIEVEEGDVEKVQKLHGGLLKNLDGKELLIKIEQWKEMKRC